MTKRDFYTAIIKSDLADELKAQAQEYLTHLDDTNGKNRTKRAEKSASANEPVKANIVRVLTENGKVMTASEVAAACEISTSKASALLRQIEGLVVTEVKGKSGKVKGYSIG